MRKVLKHMYYNTIVGNLLLTPAKKLYNIYRLRLLPEKIYLKRNFKNIFGYDLNLENPKTIQEKINWLQLNDRTQMHILCTDKYAVREYVEEKIGKQYLIPLVFHTEQPSEITPDNLPDYPFIIKTNHDCGGHIIVRDKSKVDWKNVQRELNKSLKSNFYYHTREWQYKNIKPCILVEKLLLDKDNKIPNDYKIVCYNGIVKFIEVIVDRYTNPHVSIYDPDWLIIEYNEAIIYPPGKDIKKPVNLTKMKLLAEALAKLFKFVRIDFYNIEGEIYFGEMTFSPAVGLESFPPPALANKLGLKLKL